MSDDMINIIGMLCLGGAFWYINIQKPKRKLKNPGELFVKPVMSEAEREINSTLHTLFDSPYVITNNVTMDNLIYSPEFDKKNFFRKAMRERKIGWLILNEQYDPVLAVDIATADDEVKLNCLSSAGIPCCIFTSTTKATEIAAELTQVARTLKLPFSGAVATELSPEVA